jgi:hypothetical protein
LVQGVIKEWEVESYMLCPDPKESEAEVGVHFWHIEREPGARGRGFGGAAVGEVLARVFVKGKRRWSALVVTKEGGTLFAGLGGREGGYGGQVWIEGKGVVERSNWDGMGLVVGQGRMLIFEEEGSEAARNGVVTEAVSGEAFLADT